MKFKLDENLPVELVSDFVHMGHEAHTVFEDCAVPAGSFRTRSGPALHFLATFTLFRA
jgi:hypothetical protein